VNINEQWDTMGYDNGNSGYYCDNGAIEQFSSLKTIVPMRTAANINTTATHNRFGLLGRDEDEEDSSKYISSQASAVYKAQDRSEIIQEMPRDATMTNIPLATPRTRKKMPAVKKYVESGIK